MTLLKRYILVFRISLSESSILYIGELIGLLCCHYGVKIYDELEECIVKGISDTIDRDITSADPDLMMKLGRGDNEEKEERVWKLIAFD